MCCGIPFFVSRLGGTGVEHVARVIRVLGEGEELGSSHVKMVVEWKDQCFLMQVRCVGSADTAGGSS